MTSLFTEEEERRLKWKTDMVILPIMCGVFFLRTSGQAESELCLYLGLITDLKLVGTEYLWCSSIFHIGILSLINQILGDMH